MPALGMPSRTFGQALAWYNVKRHLASHPRCDTKVLASAMQAKKGWAPFSALCWTALAGSGTVVKETTVPGRGKIHMLTVVEGRPNYTFAETRFATPPDWANNNYINITYKGTGSGKTYAIYFEFATNKVARYKLVDKSHRWRMVSTAYGSPRHRPYRMVSFAQGGPCASSEVGGRYDRYRLPGPVLALQVTRRAGRLVSLA